MLPSLKGKLDGYSVWVPVPVGTFGWYDNEWGFSNRLIDATQLVGGATA